MIVYHGSSRIVSHPSLSSASSFLDFGSGFYTTLSRKRALCCAYAAYRRKNRGKSTVNIYQLDERRAFSHGSLLRFEQPDEAWLDFVTANRSGTYTGPAYDFVRGPAADDDVCEVLQLYESGVLSKEQTLRFLDGRALPTQIVFCSDAALTYLTFVDVTWEKTTEQYLTDMPSADIMPQLIERIAEQITDNDPADTRTDTAEIAAVSAFYSSEVCALLEHEETKLWHLSPLTLYHMYKQEMGTGKFSFPEEV